MAEDNFTKSSADKNLTAIEETKGVIKKEGNDFPSEAKPAPTKIKGLDSISKGECPYCSYKNTYKVAIYPHVRKNHTEQYFKDYPERIKTKPMGRPPKNSQRANFQNENVGDKEEDSKESLESKENEEPEVTEDYNSFLQQPYKRIPHKTKISLGGRETYMAELLIGIGFAKDLSELQRKSLHLAFSLMNVGGAAGMFKEGFQEEKKPSVNEMLEEMRRREIEELQMDELKNKLLEKKKPGGGNKMEMGEAMVLMSMMNQNKGGDNNGMLQALEIFKSLGDNNKKGTDFREVMEMVKMFNQPKQDNSLQQQLEVFKLLKDNQQSNGTNMQEILKFLKDKDKDHYERSMEIQRIQDKNNMDLLKMKIAELETKLQNNPKGEWDPEEIATKINGLKKLSETIGVDKKQEPSTLDYLETIGRNFGPAVTELIKAKTGGNRPSAPVNTGAQRFQENDEVVGEEAEENAEEVMNHHREQQKRQFQQIRQQQQQYREDVPQQPQRELHEQPHVDHAPNALASMSGFSTPPIGELEPSKRNRRLFPLSKPELYSNTDYIG